MLFHQKQKALVTIWKIHDLKMCGIVLGTRAHAYAEDTIFHVSFHQYLITCFSCASKSIAYLLWDYKVVANRHEPLKWFSGTCTQLCNIIFGREHEHPFVLRFQYYMRQCRYDYTLKCKIQIWEFCILHFAGLICLCWPSCMFLFQAQDTNYQLYEPLTIAVIWSWFLCTFLLPSA